MHIVRPEQFWNSLDRGFDSDSNLISGAAAFVREGVQASDFMNIDGSSGEGGGQILRTAVSLSVITGKPIKVFNIRAKRSNPGLRPQHLTAIKTLATLFEAKIENLKVGADWVSIRPTDRFAGDVTKFEVGTAGSIPMILLTVVPAIALTGNRIRLEFTGGTDVKASPTIDYLRFVVAEAYRSIGIKFTVEVLRRGYYPKGGGTVRTEIEPCMQPNPLQLANTNLAEPKIISVCSQLPKHVAERQLTSALIALEKRGLRCASYTASLETAVSPGSSILVYSSSGFGPYIGGDSIGELGKRSEAVGNEASERYLESALQGVPVDPHLADMIVLPLALARGRSAFRIARVTKHLETNLQIASMITGCRFQVIPHDSQGFMVEIES